MATDHISAPATDSPLSAIQQHPDARLLILGRLLEITGLCTDSVVDITGQLLDTEENKDYFDVTNAIGNITDQLISLIVKENATTLEGLKTKAKAIAYCCAPEPIDIGTFGKGTSDTMIAGSIVRDLLY